MTRLYGNKRIWITEYGYQTNPPDRIFGVSFLNQARYLTQAYGIAKRNPRIDMFLWFLLRDERLGVDQGWQSGLLTAGGGEEALLRRVPEAPLAGRHERLRDEVEAFLEPDPRLVAQHAPRRARRPPRVAHIAGAERRVLLLDRLAERGADRVRQLVDAGLPAGGDVEDGAGRAVGASPASRFASTTLAT